MANIQNERVMGIASDKSFDSDFAQIAGLSWYPWVGAGYKEAKQRVLVIGDNLYAVDENGDYDEETARDFLSNRETVREYVEESRDPKKWHAKFYDRLTDTFVSEDRIDRFWNKVAFVHFFQQPDGRVSGNGHGKTERMAAWSRWQELVEVLRPDICIFCGTGLGRCYEEWNRSMGKEADWWDVESGIYKGGQQPIRGVFTTAGGHRAELVFMRHPSSRGFSSERWHEFLKGQFPDVMEEVNNV